MFLQPTATLGLNPEEGRGKTSLLFPVQPYLCFPIGIFVVLVSIARERFHIVVNERIG
jgi:hypothetical protein